MRRALRLLRRFPWSRLAIFIPLALQIYLGIQALPEHRWQINPDGVSYLSIAQQYLHLHWADALSGYWSPLYSWLLVPLLAVGVGPLLATKVLGIALGSATIVGLWRLGAALELPRDFRVVLGCLAAPMLVTFAMQVITPDLLVACAIIWYLGQISRPSYQQARGGAALGGVLAGLAYLAKAYALPLVVAHFVIANAVFIWRSGGERRLVMRRCALAAACFAAVCALWIVPLSVKFGHVTIGSTGRYNHALDGPSHPGHPHLTQGFLPPPSPTSTSSWDDPTRDVMPDWSPFDSQANWDYQVDLVTKNWAWVERYVEGWSVLVWPILVLLAVVGLSRGDVRPGRGGLLLALAMVLYPLGYLLLHVEARFLWLLPLLLPVAGAFVLRRMGTHTLAGPIVQRVALLALCWTFYAAATQPLVKHEGRDAGKALAELSEKLRPALPEGARVASDGNWGTALYESLHLQLRYYGAAAPHSPPEQVGEAVEKLPVDYFLVWGNARRFAFLKQANDVTPAGVNKPRVYRLERGQ